MIARYLLDTNIVSDFLENKPPEVRRRVLNVGLDAIALSVISEAELRYGLANKPGAFRQRVPVERFLVDATIPVWDSQAAQKYASLRVEQERKGKSLSSEDLMIAAHALSLDLILITHDAAFSFVDHLKTEDWTVA